MRVLVFIGAGASKGHTNDPALQVPCEDIRKYLFERYPILCTYPKQNIDDVEQWADRLSPSQHIVFLCALTDYFSKFNRIPTDSAYLRLIKELKNDAAYASINYDCLLELAIKKLGYGVDYGIASNKFCLSTFWNPTKSNMGSCIVLKPHGSVNWVQRNPLMQIVRTPPQQCPLVTGAGSCYLGVDQTSNFIVTANDTVRALCPSDIPPRGSSSNGNCLPSLVCTYNINKSAPFNPDIIEKARQGIENYAGKIHSLLIIGVKYREHDRHLLNAIKHICHAGAKLIYLSPDHKSSKGFRSLCKNKKAYKPVQKLFSEGLDAALEEIE